MANTSSSSLLEDGFDWDAVIEPYLYTDHETYAIYIFLPIIVLVGVIGNISTTIILATNSRMRSSLNIYLLNLAISDCIFIVVASLYLWINVSGSPLHIYYDNSIVPVEYCAVNTFFVETTYMVSATLIMTISIERFLAITMPLKYRAYVSKKRTIKICCAIWLISMIIQSRHLVTSGKIDYTWPWPDMWNGVPNTTSLCILCSYDFDYEVCDVFYSLAEYELMLYLLYLVLMMPLYLMICCSLLKPCAKKKEEIATATNRPNYERRALRTVLITVVVYISLTAPHNALWVYSFKSPVVNWDLVIRFSNVFRYLAFINCSVNPIIYNISNDAFRKSFLELYGCSSGTVQKQKAGNIQASARTSISAISTTTSL